MSPNLSQHKTLIPKIPGEAPWPLLASVTSILDQPHCLSCLWQSLLRVVLGLLNQDSRQLNLNWIYPIQDLQPQLVPT